MESGYWRGMILTGIALDEEDEAVERSLTARDIGIGGIEKNVINVKKDVSLIVA